MSLREMINELPYTFIDLYIIKKIIEQVVRPAKWNNPQIVGACIETTHYTSNLNSILRNKVNSYNFKQ
jgi:hypothetical protein